MSKFEVRFTERIYYNAVTVEADTEEEALSKAFDVLNNGNLDTDDSDWNWEIDEQ